MASPFTIFLLITTTVWTSQSFEIQTSDAEFLRKQELVFQLLWNTKETPKNHPEVFERLKNYRIEDVAAACENKTYAKMFETYLHHNRGKSSRGRTFSPFRDEHAEEARMVYGVLREAKSFDEFLAMAAWTGLLVNELGWLHGLAVALALRADTKHLRLPNLYEIYPSYFYDTETIVQSYRAKTGEIYGVGDQYVIESNYSSYPSEDDESKLSYFREDVELNEFYFHFTNDRPFWLKSSELGGSPSSCSFRGELYYHVHRLLLAKYRLERLSVGLVGDLEDIDWEQPIVTGYRPRMLHLSGVPFPSREPGSRVPASKFRFVEEAKRYESRISRALDLGELVIQESRSSRMYEPAECVRSFGEFCNALEGNADGPADPRLYGSLDRTYRRLLGFAPEATSPGSRGANVAALETSLASLRDPGFYRMSKRIVDFGIRFKRNLASYKREELGFEGVRVDYLHLEALVTFFRAGESVLNHPRVLSLDDKARKDPVTTVVRVRQWRLDHKPFLYQIGVSSERPVKAIVRVFLGPRHNEHGDELVLEDSLDLFYEIDRWVVELKQGSNKLERSSTESVYHADSPNPSDLQERLIARALRTSDESLARELASRKPRRGLPRRLMLPRGTSSGLGVQLVACLHPLTATTTTGEEFEGPMFRGLRLDGRALGFPLDRRLDLEIREMRNFMVRDDVVRHENDGRNVEKD